MNPDRNVHRSVGNAAAPGGRPAEDSLHATDNATDNATDQHGADQHGAEQHGVMASTAETPASRPRFRGLDLSSARQRRFLVTTVLLLLVLPVLVFGTHQSFSGILTLTSRWLPSTFHERQVLDRFMQDFESGDSVYLTWNDCDLNDPRLPALGIALEQFTHLSLNDDRPRLIDSVTTGGDVIEMLTQPPSRLTHDEAARRLQGILIGKDGVSSGVLISLTQDGVNHREAAMELILTESAQATGIPRDEFLLAGPPIDGWVVDQEARANVDTLTPPSILISVLLCLGCLRSWAHTAAVLTAAMAAQGILLSVMYFSGIRMNALFIVLPPLVLTLTVSAGIHLVNYFRDERDTGGTAGSVTRAISQGRGPCLLAAGTTAIGLLSLMRSEITPVTQFGWLATVGLAVGISLLFLLLPGVLERWPGDAAAREKNQRAGVSSFLQRTVSRVPTPVIVVCLALMIGLGAGTRMLKTSITHDSLFPDDSRIARDYQTLERQLGPLVPAEVLLHFEPGSEVEFLKRIRLVRDVGHTISDIDGFGGTFSAAVFYSPRASSRGGPARRMSLAERYVDFKAQVRQQSQKLQDARLLHESKDRQTWRLSTRVPALGDVDYARALKRLQDRVEQLLDRHRERGVVVTAEYTGIMPMVSLVQDVLLRDLFLSFLTAFGLVALVTIVVLRSVVAGLLVMLPNLFPAVVVFGAMGWLRIPVDIGSMMTASVAMGIAVDDTFHFLTWFRRGVHDGLSAAPAVKAAYYRCAQAMTQTTLVCGLGMAVFGLSHFVPTQNFAWLMLTLLITALIGDLVFLPALLSGVTSRVFVSQQSN
ncbi:MAG: MMPL family transporter [Fuerstiella sp.]